MKPFAVIALCVLTFFNTCCAAADVNVIPSKVQFGMQDNLRLLTPDSIRIGGFLGERIEANWKNRLLKVDEEPLLAGFRKKPGSHPWIGEHIGKWLHAATLAWVYSGDEELKKKLDRVAAELIKTQEPDGYIGTYVPEKRFGLYPEADWDVWVHKYVMIGLLTYYQYTGNQEALQTCIKAADLLLKTFGPDKKNIISAGTHVGMAATSVLEPIVMLYDFTGDERYLKFALYIVDSWDSPNGPAILKSLLSQGNVSKTANGKAYEMLSNLVGLCELARVTGERKYVEAAIRAWEDIVSKRLYITGSASQGEHFRGDFELPNGESAHVAETCVTVTWIQLNLQLLRLTGEARYANELERTIYNHLSAAQRPDGAQWCYFTPLEGRKSYGPGINCCVSSGPRGMALAPLVGCLTGRENGKPMIVLNYFENADYKVQIENTTVQISQKSEFPFSGKMLITFVFSNKSEHPVGSGKPVNFGLKLRCPDWARPVEIKYKNRLITPELRNGWLTLNPQDWNNGDELEVSFNLEGRMIIGTHGNDGLAALAYGPFVLACDTSDNPDLPSLARIGLWGANGDGLVKLKSKKPLRFEAKVRIKNDAPPVNAVFRTFADAGSDGGNYRIWLRSPARSLPENLSVLSDGKEERSRRGNVVGSIIDGDRLTYVVTFDGKLADEDYYSVTLNNPVSIKKIVFCHGHSFHDGGWFDTSGGKPVIQIKRTPQSQWETIGRIESYPDTTATKDPRLKDGQPFEFILNEPVKICGIKISGKPACGDNPKQAFSSCGELEAY